jgi:hypothetical protein
MTINFNDVTDTATPTSGTFNTGGNSNVKGGGQNLVLRSSDLTSGSWGTNNLTVTGGQTDPFGGTTAALLNDGTANTNHYLSQNYTAINATTQTYSVYAKAGTANYIGIYSPTPNQGAFFNVSTGAFSSNIILAPSSYSITNVGNGWYRVSITTTGAATGSMWIMVSEDGTNYTFTGTSKTVYIAAPQLEIGNTLNTYVPTTTTAIYNTPQLTFSGVANIGLQSDGALFVQPAGTGALQAQKTDSAATGGNARGQYAVDFQTYRTAASQVASGNFSVIAGGATNKSTGSESFVGAGLGNTASGYTGGVVAGSGNTASGGNSGIVSGDSNTSSGGFSFIGAGAANTTAGYYNIVGGGYTNSGTSASAVTTQSGTMNGTTAVTLSSSNANIKVGQYITGTSIANDTYVAAISGTSLTLSKNASGSSTSTLSFYTPHGVVVG